jgi:hypothetical protein
MAITLKPVRPVMDEELMELAERDPGCQFERTARGEHVVTPTSGRSAYREPMFIDSLTV